MLFSFKLIHFCSLNRSQPGNRLCTHSQKKCRWAENTRKLCKLGFNNLYWDFLLSWKCKTARLFSFKRSFALLAATKQNAYLCKLIQLIKWDYLWLFYHAWPLYRKQQCGSTLLDTGSTAVSTLQAPWPNSCITWSEHLKRTCIVLVL